MADRTTIRRALGAEVEIEPEKSITGAVSKHDHYAHDFIHALLSNEDVTRKFFLRYPEVARVQFYVDDVIRMDLRRPDDVEEETRKTLETIGKKLYGFEPVTSQVSGIFGTAAKGPVGKAMEITSYEECVRIFGEPTKEPDSVSAAAMNFFWNGGRACLVVRDDGPAVQKDYRKMLEEVGGWDNELASVPAGGVREVVEEVESLRARVVQYETLMMALPHSDQLREIMARALREDRDFLPAPTRHLFPCGTQQNDMLHTLVRLFARAVDLELARWRFASTVSSVRKYPREVVCLNCEEVVAYATINAIPQSPMLAAELIRPDGSYPEACDPGCLNCLPGGPFRLRDRVTGEWIGGPPPEKDR